MNRVRMSPIVQIPIKQIVIPKTNARSVRDDVNDYELANSMSHVGQIYPVLLYRIKEDKYGVFVGSRRFESAWKAEMPVIDARILDDIPDSDMIMLSLTENLHRKDLTPFEEAKAMLKLCKEHEMSPKQIAKEINKPLAFVTGRLKILSVPEKVQDILCQSGATFINHIGIIASLGKPRDQIRYAKIVAKQRLSEEDLVTLIRDEVKIKDGARAERPASIELFTPMRTAIKVNRFAKFLRDKVRPQLVLEGPETIKIRKSLREVRNMINELLARR